MSSKAMTPAPGAAPRRAPEDGADAGGQLVGMERLGDVVVGAEVEALGLVGGRALGGQQDDRHRPALAQLAHDLDAVEVGHDDVEQDDVGPDLLGLLERLLAAAGGDDAEALFAERDRDELGDARLVVGDEHERLGAHSNTSWVGVMVTDMAGDVSPSAVTRSARRTDRRIRRRPERGRATAG